MSLKSPRDNAPSDPGRMHTPPPHLSLRARRRNPDGAELAVDVAARGGPAIAGVALLALVVAYVLRWLG